jgi:DNA modification methylase
VSVRIIIGDCREKLAKMSDAGVHCCVTSPPYFGLRDYGVDEQMGLEPTPDEFVEGMVAVFREVRRVLRDDGTLWLNIGDSYAGSGRGAWNVPDEVKTAAGIKETYRPDVAAHRVTSDKNNAVTKGAGEDRLFGCKAKDLIGIPWMLAFALRADGWYLRQDIIWSKPNPMPESVQDRCTKAHEYIFMLSKSPRYYYDPKAIAEPAIYSGLTGQDDSGFKNAANFGGKHAANPEVRREGSDKQRGHGRRHAGFNDLWDQMSKAEQCSGTRNKRSVWTVATKPFAEAHFATFPPALIEPCILAGCPKGGLVLDPFGGAGTTGLVADRHGRDAILIELNPEYAAIAQRRIAADGGMFSEVKAA